jgi:hypothetical protein
MKTKNNVQKAVLRFAAVVAGLVMISYTASAQDLEKSFIENNSFSDIAMVITEAESPVAENAITIPAADFMFETETENVLELELWMTDEAIFAVTFEIDEEADEALELEPWMMNQELFQTATETDPELNMEDWMVSDALWSI